MTGEPMTGGVNTVLRIGDRVHRPSGEWTPAVHAVLEHLAAKGFSAAPRAYGFDAEGREILRSAGPGRSHVVRPARRQRRLRPATRSHLVFGPCEPPEAI